MPAWLSAHIPQLTILVRLSPGEVVMVVNRIEYARAEYLGDAIAGPIPAGVSVAARQFHGRNVVLAFLSPSIERNWRRH